MSLVIQGTNARYGQSLLWIGGLIAACLAVVAGFVRLTEPQWDGAALALSAFALIGVAIFAVTRRALVSVAIAMLVFLLIWISAEFKYAVMAMNLHVYDAMLYLTAWSKFSFFLGTFPRQSALVGALLLTTVLILMLLWWVERPWAVSGRTRLATLGLAVVAVGAAALPFQDRNVHFFIQRNYVFSSFFASMGDLPDLVRFEGGIKMARAGQAPLAASGDIACKPGPDAPDIVLFLHESAMPPGVYPEIRYPKELTPHFTSGDGVIRPFRVETFGGGTWLTDFSTLTGLATRGFGSLQNFAGQLMTDRIRHSLPQYLKACGYDTTMVYPTDAAFAGTRRFYQSIGFDRVIDAAKHRAVNGRQRDAFYLGLVGNQLKAAGENGTRRPQFIVASSMASHGPWDFKFAPEAAKPGETLRWNADAEMDEYLWRLLLARRDHAEFRQRIQGELPGRRILYVDYGDHQPSLAAIPLKQAVAIADGGRSWQMDPASKGFETYYAVSAQGFVPHYPSRALPILEAANLPVVTVMAAGLPLDPVMAERARLLERCNGLYGTCPNHEQVLAFQRWLADGGWVTSR